VPAELEKIAADLAFEEGPPHLDDALCRGGRRRACQCFARQEAHRLGECRVVAVAHMLIALPAVALVKHCREIVGQARHAPCPQRLDPRLLHAFEDGSGCLSGREALCMKCGVVIAEFQRHGVRGAAHGCCFLRVQLAARERQADARSGMRRRLSAIAHGDIGPLGNRPQRRRGGALEDIERGVVVRHDLHEDRPRR